MLRECIRHEPLAKIILFSEQFRDFFKYVEMSTFDIASDAFATFKVNYSIPASQRCVKNGTLSVVITECCVAFKLGGFFIVQ